MCDYVIDAVHLVAEHGWKLLPDYRFEPTSGLWHHTAATPDPPLSLTALAYDGDGTLTYPRAHPQVDESALPGYLEQARALFAALPGEQSWRDDEPNGLNADAESLRWFPLPAVCVTV